MLLETDRDDGFQRVLVVKRGRLGRAVPHNLRVGIEPPAAHEPSFVRLDPDSEKHHGVNVGVTGHELQHIGDRVAGLAAREVDRVVATPPGRQLLVDGRAEISG